jgi:hypothetical protein
MIRITTLFSAAILWACIAKVAPVEAEASLVSAWQHCEQGKGCSKFAFMPNGQVIEQFPLAGGVVTAYGHYHVRGPVLKISWKRFAPSQMCGSNRPGLGDAEEQCSPIAQPDFKGPFRFEGFNALLWLRPDEPPLRLLRVEL